MAARLPGEKNGRETGKTSSFAVIGVVKIKPEPSTMPTRKPNELRAVLSEIDLDRIIEMAWEDRTPFEAIKAQFGITEAEVIALMRAEMRLQNWKKWRARVQCRATKRLALRSESVQRFRCKMQRQITRNKISKRF